MKLVNQQLIKNTNLKQLYNSIYQNPGTSRAQLSKDSHLSKTAVSSLVDELIARKFVYDSGTGGSPTACFSAQNNTMWQSSVWRRTG